MATKNGKNGDCDMTPEIIEQALKLYDLIRQADDVKREPVEVPEWGATVIVQTLSADDRDDYEQWLSAERSRLADEGMEPNIRGIRAKVAVMCIVDETGNHVFSDADREWLGRKSSVALDRIFTVADRLSGLTGQAREEARKNSGTEEAASSALPSD